MKKNYYKSGSTPFYTIADNAGDIIEAWHFDATEGALVSDFAEVTRRLYLSSSETEEITEADFRILLKKARLHHKNSEHET